jgi:hypothetical protein
MHLLDFYPTIQIAYERRTTDRISLQADIGYVFNTNSNNDREYQDKRGIKMNLEGRYYFPSRTISKSGRLYMGAEAYTTIIDFDREKTIIGCFDLNCQMQFSKKSRYEVKYRESGFALKLGRAWRVRHILFDMNVGLDLRFVNYIKPSFDNRRTNGVVFFYPNENNRTQLSPALGFRLGYCFY